MSKKPKQEASAVADAREERELKKALRELSETVTAFLRLLDFEMRRPGNPADRGKKIAALANELDFANDRVRYFSLGVNFRTDRKRTTGDAAQGVAPESTSAAGGAAR